MSGGLPLVRAYLDAFLGGRTEEFSRQLAPAFRYSFLPLDYGEGIEQARRWRAFCFSVYRKWQWTITDSSEAGSKVVVWLHFVGSDPAEPDVPFRCEDTSLLEFEIENGLIVRCEGMHPTLEGHVEPPEPARASSAAS